MCAFLTAMVILTPNYNKMQFVDKALSFYPVNIYIFKKKSFSFERGDKSRKAIQEILKIGDSFLGEDFFQQV